MQKAKNLPRSTDLTERQQEIMQLVAVGATDDEIGSLLGITRTTVRTHIAACLVRLGVHTRGHAVAELIRRKVIT
jgi:DNA-binding CsgD family transcriptional regulator